MNDHKHRLEELAAQRKDVGFITSILAVLLASIIIALSILL